MTVDNDNELRPLPGSGWLCLPGGLMMVPTLSHIYNVTKQTNAGRTHPDCQNIVTKLHPLKHYSDLSNQNIEFWCLKIDVHTWVPSYHHSPTVPWAITEAGIVIYVKQTQKLSNLNNYVSSGPRWWPCPMAGVTSGGWGENYYFFSVSIILLLPAAAW